MMNKPECNICGELHHKEMDCVSILRGSLHQARMQRDTAVREKDDLDLVCSDLKQRVATA